MTEPFDDCLCTVSIQVYTKDDFKLALSIYLFTQHPNFLRIRVVILPLIISHKFPFESDSTSLSNIHNIYVFIGRLQGSGTATVDKDSSSLKLFGCKSPSKGGQL